MRDLYLNNDKTRGVNKTFIKLVEEIGELAESIFLQNQDRIEEEIADIIAWTVSLANLLDIDVEKILYKKYPHKCPKCGQNPCICKY